MAIFSLTHLLYFQPPVSFISACPQQMSSLSFNPRRSNPLPFRALFSRPLCTPELSERSTVPSSKERGETL